MLDKEDIRNKKPITDFSRSPSTGIAVYTYKAARMVSEMF
jgi:hypothetical protein